MRIAHVITRLIVGGAQENTVASVLGLRGRHQLDVQLISGPTQGSEGSLLPVLNANEFPITEVTDLVRPVHPLRDFRALRTLTSLFRETKPDLVHTHSGKAGILGRIAARKAGVPVIVHTIHGPSFGRFQGAVANWVFRFAERRVGRFTDHFVSVSEAMTDQYLAAGIGSRPLYTKILSGFDLEPFHRAQNDPALRSRLGLAESDFVIGKIARLAPLKGLEDLLRILPELTRDCPRLKLVLVGDGPLRPELEKEAARLGVQDHVRFAGLVAPADIPRYFGIMDIVVHFSYREGLPRAVSQGMAAAKPVVAYDCDGAREVCRDGQTGFLIPPGDLTLAKKRICELSRNPELRSKLGHQGQRLVTELFSVERMVDELRLLYGRLWEARKASGRIAPADSRLSRTS